MYEEELEKIYTHFGPATQLKKMYEEITELKVAFNKSRGRFTKEIKEELVDVLVVGMQLYQQNYKTLNPIVKRKIERTLMRIESRYYDRGV